MATKPNTAVGTRARGANSTSDMAGSMLLFLKAVLVASSSDVMEVSGRSQRPREEYALYKGEM
jgi:hypothetical protein